VSARTSNWIRYRMTRLIASASTLNRSRPVDREVVHARQSSEPGDRRYRGPSVRRSRNVNSEIREKDFRRDSKRLQVVHQALLERICVGPRHRLWTRRVCKEALFRGVIQTWIFTWSNVHVAVLAAAVLFGITHAISIRYALFIAGLGVAFGYLFYFTESLFAAMLAHAVYDFVALYLETRVIDQRHVAQTVNH